MGRGRRAAVPVEVGVGHPPGRYRPPVVARRPPYPGEAVRRRGEHAGSGDHADPAVPEPEYLAADEVPARLVLRYHAVAGQLVPADQGEPAAGAQVRLQLAVQRAGERGVVVPGTGEDQRGDLMRPEQLDVLQFAVRVAVAVADDDQPAMRGRDPLQSPGDLGEVRVGHVVHDDADRAALRAGQVLRVRVRYILQLGDCAQYPGPQLLGHQLRAAVDDPRGGGRGDARQARDVGERGHNVRLSTLQVTVRSGLVGRSAEA